MSFLKMVEDNGSALVMAVRDYVSDTGDDS